MPQVCGYQSPQHQRHQERGSANRACAPIDACCRFLVSTLTAQSSGSKEGFGVWWNKTRGARIFTVAVLVLLGFVGGSAVHEFTQYKQAGVGAAIGLPAIIALFGMFWIAQNWKDAITASFLVAYLIYLAGILALFVFAGQSLPLDSGAKAVLDNFSGLVGTVMVAYFGQEAFRAGAEAYRQTHTTASGSARAHPTAGAPASHTHTTTEEAGHTHLVEGAGGHVHTSEAPPTAAGPSPTDPLVIVDTNALILGGDRDR